MKKSTKYPIGMRLKRKRKIKSEVQLDKSKNPTNTKESKMSYYSFSQINKK